MEVDFSITQPAHLIGKLWKCPACKEIETITLGGIDHQGHKHWRYCSLIDLFDIQIAEQNLERRIHEIMFRE